jgi:hypothetical protein
LKAHSVIAGLVLLSIVSLIFAVEPPAPQEFIGDWIPQNLCCNSPVRLRVESASVLLIYGADSQEFANLDICHSCAGGSKYGGQIVWLIPEFGRGVSPFTVRFNENEESGITIMKMQNSDLRQRFPLHDMKMRKCPN